MAISIRNSFAASQWVTAVCSAVVGAMVLYVSQKTLDWLYRRRRIDRHVRCDELLANLQKQQQYDMLGGEPQADSLSTEVGGKADALSEESEGFQPYANRVRPVDVPEDAPDSCPGVNSESAGKGEMCGGCPNQQLCASGEARKPPPEASEISAKLASIRHKVLVLSGKGGVGKSTVASQIAWTLQGRGFEVGLLDVDICGPSIPRMTGSSGRDVHLSADGWSPIYVEDNFAVMSIGFLMSNEDDAVIWRGPKKNGLIRQFLTDVTWGVMDFLIIDTPPGTSDEHLSIVTYLKEAVIDGAVVVTTPQEVSLQDVRKEINFCKRVEIPVLGVVENMTNSVFVPLGGGGAKEMCVKMDVPYAGSISMDSSLMMACEEGRSVIQVDRKCKSSIELSNLVEYLLQSLNEPLFADGFGGA